MIKSLRKIGSRQMSLKTTILTIALVLFAVTAIAARYESLDVSKLRCGNIARLSENDPLDISYDGTFTKTDADGNIEEYVAADSVVVIGYDDLSTLTDQAATGGASVFWASPGVTYLVDIMDIGLHFGVGSGIAFTGVTCIAPLASSENDGKTFSVIWAYPSGATGYGVTHSGNTRIHVRPFCAIGPGSTTASVTAYGLSTQSVQSIYEPLAYGVTSGGSIWYINRMGDSYTGKLQYDAGASVFMVKSLDH